MVGMSLLKVNWKKLKKRILIGFGFFTAVAIVFFSVAFVIYYQCNKSWQESWSEDSSDYRIKTCISYMWWFDIRFAAICTSFVDTSEEIDNDGKVIVSPPKWSPKFVHDYCADYLASISD
jgi:hypothetical protein